MTSEPSAAAPKERARAWCLAATVWGFAEAMLFFLVPDVLLTWIALSRPRLALRACAFATLGALFGGALMYAWGHADYEGARASLELVPGISDGLIAEVEFDLEERGLESMFVGPTRGIPYKVYAAAWGGRAGDVGAFLAATVPARLLRFLVVTLFAVGVQRLLLANRPASMKRVVHVLSWTAFYTAYFRAMAS